MTFQDKESLMSVEIQNLFTDIAPTYDCLNHLLSFNIDKVWRKKTIAKIPQDPTSHFEALDLCAGTLDLSLEFLKQFPQARVVSADFSRAMLIKGIDKAGAANLKRMAVVCADALHLPFADNSFDALFCGFGYRNLDNKDGGLGEMARVLKPGGTLLILDFFRPEKWASRLFHHTYGNFLLPTVGRLISQNKEAYRYLHTSIDKFLSAGECQQLFIKNGFNNVQIKNNLMGISSIISGVKS